MNGINPVFNAGVSPRFAGTVTANKTMNDALEGALYSQGGVAPALRNGDSGFITAAIENAFAAVPTPEEKVKLVSTLSKMLEDTLAEREREGAPDTSQLAFAQVVVTAMAKALNKK